MIVKSLFDGYSAGYMALKKAGIKITKYEAYEIDKYCIQVSLNNHPEIIQKGDVRNCKVNSWIDLLIAGSPCQGFSKAGNQLNFEHKQSKLFFEFVRILKESLKINSNVLFLLENVRMKKEWQDIITKIVGVNPILINSSLVSAQNRERLYWTNIPGITQPKDKKIELKDIIQSGDVDRDKSYCIDANYFKGTNVKQYLCKKRRQIVWIIPEATKKGFVEVSEGSFIDLTFIKSKTRRGRLMLKKSNCLTATNYKYCKVTKDWFRLLTPIECERLQTLPDDYTKGVSNMQRYEMLGNGWTIDVISHIFSFIPCPEENYSNSDVCQKCANCCKAWWLYTDLKDDAIRASWLDTDKISVIKVKDGLWKIIFNIPCKELIEKDGKFWCKKYNSPNKPSYCKSYPANFKGEIKEVIEAESKLCPIIKEVV